MDDATVHGSSRSDCVLEVNSTYVGSTIDGHKEPFPRDSFSDANRERTLVDTDPVSFVASPIGDAELLGELFLVRARLPEQAS